MTLPGGRYRIQAPNVTERIRTALGLVGRYDAVLEETIQPVIDVSAAAGSAFMLLGADGVHEATVRADGSLEVHIVDEEVTVDGDVSILGDDGTHRAAVGANKALLVEEVSEAAALTPFRGAATAPEGTGVEEVIGFGTPAGVTRPAVISGVHVFTTRTFESQYGTAVYVDPRGDVSDEISLLVLGPDTASIGVPAGGRLLIPKAASGQPAFVYRNEPADGFLLGRTDGLSVVTEVKSRTERYSLAGFWRPAS